MGKLHTLLIVIILFSPFSMALDQNKPTHYIQQIARTGTSLSIDSNQNGWPDKCDSLIEPSNQPPLPSTLSTHPLQQIRKFENSLESIDANGNGWPDKGDSLSEPAFSIEVDSKKVSHPIQKIRKTQTSMISIDADGNGWPDKCDSIDSPLPLCGDGTCNAGETCSSCPADCPCPQGQTCISGVCQTPAAYCGNNIQEAGESCDGSDLGTETCQSLGYNSGNVYCLSDCSGFDTTNCITNPNCDVCQNCDTIFSPCSYQECKHDCGTGCYYRGTIAFVEDCVDLNYACNNLISSCGDYSDEECNSNPCGVSSACSLSAGICVETEIPICSDGTCNGAETCASCPSDCGSCATGTVFYVDPINGNMGNDGSYNHPWRTLQEVFELGLIETKTYETLPYQLGAPLKTKNPGAPVKAGDTILLRSGYHGEVVYFGAYNSDYITIAAQTGHTPYLKRIRLAAASKWILRGLTITLESAPVYEQVNLVSIENNGWYGPSSDVIIEDNNLYSVQDPSGWTGDDWNNLAAGRGINTQGANIIIRNNIIKNIAYGMVVTGNNVLVEHNLVENIAFDGMVGGANDLTIQYNTFKNFYRTHPAQHDDGIQFHKGTDPTPLENVVVRGNLIMYKDPNVTSAFLMQPQGIVGFDLATGTFRNFLIENNIIISPTLHGIALYGATDSRIINNIVFDPTREYSIWISVNNIGRNTVVRNNMAYYFIVDGEGMTVDHNIDLDDYTPETLFVDYQNYDMRHRAGSPAIDAGSPSQAPNIDIDGISRPQGSGFDIGAYEYS